MRTTDALGPRLQTVAGEFYGCCVGVERTDGGPDGLSRRRVLSLCATGLVVLCVGCSGDDGAPVSDDPGLSPDGYGFGTVVDAGSLRGMRNDFRDQGWTYVPEARSYLVPYPREKIARAKSVYPQVLHAGLEAGLLALYQKCPHLGCRVPNCATSAMFECPCHAGIFSAYGEWRAGPPRRGMDLFAIRVLQGRVFLDTGHVVEGLGRSVDVSGQIAQGPHCV